MNIALGLWLSKNVATEIELGAAGTTRGDDLGRRTWKLGEFQEASVC